MTTPKTTKPRHIRFPTHVNSPHRDDQSRQEIQVKNPVSFICCTPYFADSIDPLSHRHNHSDPKKHNDNPKTTKPRHNNVPTHVNLQHRGNRSRQEVQVKYPVSFICCTPYFADSIDPLSHRHNHSDPKKHHGIPQNHKTTA